MKVEPIREKSKLQIVENNLKRFNRLYMVLFVFGINTGLRISDILKLHVGDVKNRGRVCIIEKKTKKRKIFYLNERLKRLLKYYLRKRKEQELLFVNRNHLVVNQSTIYRAIKRACAQSGINYNVGTHTMRKTFGYHHYKKFHDIAILQTIFNHSSPKITLDYIGISQEEIETSYKAFTL